MSVWVRLSCTLHSAVPEPGRLLQQSYIASIGVTPRASGASESLASQVDLQQCIESIFSESIHVLTLTYLVIPAAGYTSKHSYTMAQLHILMACQ